MVLFSRECAPPTHQSFRPEPVEMAKRLNVPNKPVSRYTDAELRQAVQALINFNEAHVVPVNSQGDVADASGDFNNPATLNGFDLGSPDQRWRDLYLAGSIFAGTTRLILSTLNFLGGIPTAAARRLANLGNGFSTDTSVTRLVGVSNITGNGLLRGRYANSTATNASFRLNSSSDNGGATTMRMYYIMQGGQGGGAGGGGGSRLLESRGSDALNGGSGANSTIRTDSVSTITARGGIGGLGGRGTRLNLLNQPYSSWGLFAQGPVTSSREPGSGGEGGHPSDSGVYSGTGGGYGKDGAIVCGFFTARAGENVYITIGSGGAHSDGANGRNSSGTSSNLLSNGAGKPGVDGRAGFVLLFQSFAGG